MEEDYFDAWDKVSTPKEMIVIIAHDVRMFPAIALGVIQAIRGEMAKPQIPLPILTLEKLAQRVNKQVNSLLSLRELPEGFMMLDDDRRLDLRRAFLNQVADIHARIGETLQSAREAIAEYKEMPEPHLKELDEIIVLSLDARAIKTKQYIDVALMKQLPLKLQA